MSKNCWILLLFLLAVGEAALLAIAGHYVAWRILVGGSLATAVAGFGVVVFALWRYAPVFLESLKKDEPLQDDTLSGLTLLVAGCLLLAPGFITDVIAIVLLFPAVRRMVVGWLRK